MKSRIDFCSHMKPVKTLHDLVESDLQKGDIIRYGKYLNTVYVVSREWRPDKLVVWVCDKPGLH